jgi:alcohol dehydrogenase (cytochrome c)
MLAIFAGGSSMGRRTYKIALACFSFAWTSAFVAASADGPEITANRLANSDREPQNWLSFFGNYAAWGYSGLGQINRKNVARLVPAWSFSTGEKGLGSAPLVADGVLYLLAPRSQVFALDAATGHLIWTHRHEAPPPRTPRPALGMAAGFGMLFFATEDNHLVALDAKTGEEVWDTQIEDPVQCGCGPGWSPILVKGKIVMGQSGDGARRGSISAYDAKSGKLAWRFWGIPGPGESHHESWPETLWKVGTASTWFVGSFDPELNLIYWGVGNPGPMVGGTFGGDKLYTESLVALDADTGSVKWHFQETPNDKLDYDSVPEPTLFDARIGGTARKLVIHSTKGGFAYVLDRATGTYISGFAYADALNWTQGLDANGKPMQPVLQLSEADSILVCPGAFGAHGGAHSSYSPRTGLWYTNSYEACTWTTATKVPDVIEGRGYNAAVFHKTEVPAGKHPNVSAFDPLSGKKKWSFPTAGPNLSSLLSTAGDLIFGGDIFGEAWALDATTGRKLWSFNMGSGISSVPVSYAVGSRQYVAMGAGVSSFGMALANEILSPEQKAKIPPVASTLFVFALPSPDRSAGQ